MRAPGQLLGESPGIRPLALHLTRGEVDAFHAAPRPFDIETDYGRLRFSNSVGTTPDGRAYLLQVGLPLQADGRGAVAVSRSADVAGADRAGGRGRRVVVAVEVRAAAADARRRRGADDRRADARAAAAGARRRRRARSTWWTRSTRRSAGSKSRSATCGSSAPRWRTSCARRWPRCAARSTWRCARPRRARRSAKDSRSQLEEIDRLTRLIDRILTLARAESGQIKLARAPVDLSRAGAPPRRAARADRRREVDRSALRAPCGVTAAGAPAAAAPVVVEGDAGWLERLVLESRRQRREVHPRGRTRRRPCDARRKRRSDRRRRHRRRPVAGGPAARIRAVFPGRRVAVVVDRRRGSRPQPGAVDRRTAWRRHRRAEPARRRLDVHGDLPNSIKQD